LLEYVKCNLCGKDAYDVLYQSTLIEREALSARDLSCSNLGHGRHHRIVRCKKCGLIYSNPRDSTGLIDDSYVQVKDEQYLKFSEARVITFRKALKHVEELKSGKSLLDVGCHAGVFMKTAVLGGWHAVGIEPSLWACEARRKERSLNIINASIYNAEDIKDKFDLITLWDVIEHLTDPKSVLQICRDKLLDDGIIAISTMRCQGFFYRLCGRRWPWFMRMHLYYFTTKTITEMLKLAGFKVIRIRPYIHYVSLGYLFYKLTSGNDRFFNSLGLTNIIVPVQLGDFMEVYASKS